MVERFMAYLCACYGQRILNFYIHSRNFKSGDLFHKKKLIHSRQKQKIRVANRDKTFSSLEHVFSLVP